MSKVGLGGSCHWCTEAIFNSLKGVVEVEQGWIASTGEHADLSEAILVHYDAQIIPLEVLIAVHLYSHNATSNHSMRDKYRSAIYTMDDEQHTQAQNLLIELQKDFEAPIVTMTLPFVTFKLNQEEYLDYYYKNPDKPFCETYINPKLKKIMSLFPSDIDAQKLKHLTIT